MWRSKKVFVYLRVNKNDIIKQLKQKGYVRIK